MNPKLKLLALVLISTSMLFYANIYYVSAVAAVSIAMIFALRVHRRFMPWVKPLFILFFVIVVLQSFAFSGSLFSLNGLFYGILFSLRLVALVGLVFLFVETTPASRLAQAFDFLPGDISQVLMLALAMVPGVAVLAEKIMNAQKARGLNFRNPNIFRTYFPIMVPLFAKTLFHSEKMSLAMQARGHGNE